MRRLFIAINREACFTFIYRLIVNKTTIFAFKLVVCGSIENINTKMKIELKKSRFTTNTIQSRYDGTGSICSSISHVIYTNVFMSANFGYFLKYLLSYNIACLFIFIAQVVCSLLAVHYTYTFNMFGFIIQLYKILVFHSEVFRIFGKQAYASI